MGHRRFNLDWAGDVWFRSIREARNVDDLQHISDSVRGFNRQVVRIAVLTCLVDLLRPTSFTETGTFSGETSIVASRLFQLPVYTIEANLKHYLKATVARFLTNSRSRVNQFWGDSTIQLREIVIRSNRLGPRPMFYLDAHSTRYPLPLKRELEVLRQLPWSVIVIDDFCVPGLKGFGFDCYNGVRVDFGLVR